jgi:type I restriction enzyme, S subunit
MINNENWEFFKLSELATFRRGSFPQPYGLDKWYDDENGYPFVQVFDVGDNMRLKDSTKRRISTAAGEQSVFVKKGTIVLTIQGSIGRIAIVHYDTYVDRTLLIFQTFIKPTDKRFFMFVVHRLFEDEKQRANGGVIKTITKEQLSSFIIPLPPLPEQQKIAEILNTVDDKIDIIEQQISETHKLKKGLMQRLLTKGIGHTSFKKSKLGEIPEGWEVAKLEDYSLKITDGSHFSPTPKKNTGYYIATVKDMRRSAFSLDACANISEEDFKALERNGCKPQINDVLFSKDGTIGKTFVYKEGQEIVILSSVSIIRLMNQKLISDFVCQVLKSNIFYKQLEGLKSGSAIRRLVLKAIKEIKIPVPSLDEQQKIATIISSVDKKLEVLSDKKSHYQELKKGLMQQLLTGKIRVNSLINKANA